VDIYYVQKNQWNGNGTFKILRMGDLRYSWTSLYWLSGKVWYIRSLD